MSYTEKALQPMLPMYSGQVIGAVVKALDLDHPVLKERTARRFFAGRSVSEYSHAQILRAIGQVLVETGIVPVPSAFQKYDISMPNIIAEVIARESQRWDKLVATMQSRSGTTDAPTSIVDFLRILTVDLAIRVFALLRLSEIEPSNAQTPLWAQEKGGGKFLRSLAQQANLTRAQLTARLSAYDTTVDNWLDGNHRPTTENIGAIANVVAYMIPGSEAQQIEQDIRCQFTFAHLADLVALQIGREQTVELSSALVRFVRLITLDVNGMARPSIKEIGGDEVDALRFGAAAHWVSHVLLPNLAIAETDADWKGDILAATDSWNVSFQKVGARNIAPRSAAGLAQDILDVSDEGIEIAATEAFSQLEVASNNRDYWHMYDGGLSSSVRMMESGIIRRRAIVRDFPASASAHFQLGSCLGMVGKWMGRRDLVDEGVTECKIAAALLPEWDNPAVEPGIMLANIGAFDKALTELTKAHVRLPKPTPHLRFATGYVLMELTRYTEALEQFEAVIEARPDYALASLYAARCAFNLGNTQKGISYAKTARRLGEPDEYNAWRERRRKSKAK